MCGICGELRFDGRPAELRAVIAMNDVLSPRGPDAEGVFAQNDRAMAHQRLAIMDLSHSAQQPMVDAELGLGVVFNGAVYNHHELRRELISEGYRFFSHSDTEVLLKAYHRWGEDFVTRLQGMFAFAIWERDSARALLGRDRLGIKPLYLSRNGSRLRFASTLPALVASGDVDTGIDVEALAHYLSFHAVVPAPLTILRGVRKLPPATILRVEADGRTRERRYWTLNYERSAEDEARPLAQWRDGLLEQLKLAVRRRTVAEVPVGVLLSGGVDSSLIVGLLAESGMADGLKTFSVGFEDAGEEKGNEFRYSEIIATRFGTDHTRIFADRSRLLDTLPQVIGAMSEPMVSHDCPGFFMLAEEVSKHIRVVQSGQGADEVFGGYHWYPPLEGSNRPADEYRRAFMDCDHEEYLNTVSSRFADGTVADDFVERHFAATGASDPVDKALRLDTTVMLVDDPVKRVDNMTMRFGLEARVPFLDHELVEFAARIPSRHKIAGGGKHVLKEAARQVIPPEVIDRPKGYFPVPQLKYLDGPFLEFVRDGLSSRAARERGLFREEYVEKLLDDPSSNITPLGGSRLWQLGLLEAWLQTHQIR